ncbi:MAG: hypothetical protein ABL915_07500 [Gallionella sp.]
MNAINFLQWIYYSFFAAVALIGIFTTSLVVEIAAVVVFGLYWLFALLVERVTCHIIPCA